MSEFVSYDIVTEATVPIPQSARLIGDGWYIEVSKRDEHTLSIRCAGAVVGAGTLKILPGCSNEICVTNDTEFEIRVCKDVQKALDVRRRNDEFWKGKERKKS